MIIFEQVREGQGEVNDDTTAVSIRNSISDVTFYDTTNIVTRIRSDHTDQFPFLFIEKNRIMEKKATEMIMGHLKNGKEIPPTLFHEDWITIIIVVSAFLYAGISAFPERLVNGIRGFFLFRSSGENSTGDTGGIFHWQSTLFNLVSLLNTSLFIYCCFAWYNLSLPGIRGIIFWLLIFLTIVAALIIRHLTCFLTGKISGERAAFNEYTNTIYQFNRLLAFILFIITILISYTRFLPVKSLFLTGFIISAGLYTMRIIKLFYIFLNRNISILYLILYLCALELLPVVVLIKYFAGLF
ncbi:MAG: DUF4271 domain-containing protein [Spirochaetes bacterium]|nr:DUF4271 domain-containing protein [Spirochaetota bacterium]MBN2862363.1 DUF4271 domain-containing protein [Bacteroidales bacterium]